MAWALLVIAQMWLNTNSVLQKTLKLFGTIMTMWLSLGMLLNMLKVIRCIAVIPVVAPTRSSQKTSPPSLG